MKTNNITLLLSILTLATLQPVHGMDYIAKTIDSTKNSLNYSAKLIRKHPVVSTVATLLGVGAVAYYVINKNEAPPLEEENFPDWQWIYESDFQFMVQETFTDIETLLCKTDQDCWKNIVMALNNLNLTNPELLQQVITYRNHSLLLTDEDHTFNDSFCIFNFKGIPEAKDNCEKLRQLALGEGWIKNTKMNRNNWLVTQTLTLKNELSILQNSIKNGESHETK